MGYAFANLFGIIATLWCAAAFYNAIRTDPGFVPKATDAEIKMVSTTRKRYGRGFQAYHPGTGGIGRPGETERDKFLHRMSGMSSSYKVNSCRIVGLYDPSIVGSVTGALLASIITALGYGIAVSHARDHCD